MQAFDSTGEFWLPGPYGVKQYGRLVFDPVDGATLTLAEPLVERMPNGEEHEKEGGMRRRILGQIDYGNHRQQVTLIDSINGSRRLYRPNSLLIGGHFETDEETVFESVIVRLRDAAPWVNRKAITVDDDRPVGGVERRDIACRLDVPERSHARFSRGEIDLAFHWSRHDVELESFAIEYWPEFTIEYDAQTSLSGIIEDVGNLQSLSSLCVDRSDVFISLRLYRSDHPDTNLNGAPIEGTRRPIELKARMHEPGQQLNAKRMQAHRVVVPLDEFGGVAAIATWLDRVPRVTPIVGSLLTMRAQSIYAENRFLNVSSAAEGLHRAIVGRGRFMPKTSFDKLRRAIREQMVPPEHQEWFTNVMAHANDFDLDRRLNDLVAELGSLASFLVGENTMMWVKAVKKARNNLTHLEDNRQTFDGSDLYWLAESLFQVTRLCLLMHTGLAADRLPKIVQHIHGWSDTGKLERAVQRIAGQST
ncbi:ApeA N-terminal domain 1-containing protein [Actinoplanes subglobosus]|uniref:HEPN domain-containing protein n=1 Tax=Actinoplanes subglobosus TaxID=1547892 RepID=A0ABV8IT04_9ACTN